MKTNHLMLSDQYHHERSQHQRWHKCFAGLTTCTFINHFKGTVAKDPIIVSLNKPETNKANIFFQEFVLRELLLIVQGNCCINYPSLAPSLDGVATVDWVPVLCILSINVSVCLLHLINIIPHTHCILSGVVGNIWCVLLCRLVGSYLSNILILNTFG